MNCKTCGCMSFELEHGHCPDCAEDWRLYRDLVEEGFPPLQAKVMAGLADPPYEESEE